MDEKDKIITYCRSLNVGDKIKFTTEKQRYKVKAKNERYLICTKPYNLIHHVLYTIIDLDRFVRGRNDRIFNPYDYMIQEDIDNCLSDLTSGKIAVSRRHCIPLDIEIK